MKDRKKEIKNGIFLILVIAVWCATMSLSGIGCPIKFMTGVSCGGCGMSRAYYYLLTGNLEKAWRFHPLFPCVPVVVLFLLFKKHINKYVYNVILFTIIGAFVILYVFRLLNPSDTVVVFNPREGFIFKLIFYIVDLIK